MKTIYLSVASLFLLLGKIDAQIAMDTVSVGAGYSQQVWYSLSEDVQKQESKDNWDLAFEINGFTASILANTQKTGFALYAAPYSIAGWATIDTNGLSAWPMLYNSDTSWALGALNRTADLSDPNDLGWGVYDFNTHYVNGDSCYIVKTGSTYKKLKINTLGNGSYDFTYADIDGSNELSVSIAKADYPGKNFVYYDFVSQQVLDREPSSSTWDLTFVKYTAFVPTPYGVTGVLLNKNIHALAVYGVDVNSYTVNNANGFVTPMNTIGYDWKYFDLGANQWILSDSLVYLIEDQQGDIWKLFFTEFGGSANGNFIFGKEKLFSSSVSEQMSKQPLFTIFPNPATSDVFISLHKAENTTHLKMYSIEGQLVWEQNLEYNSSNVLAIPQDKINNKGLYIIELQSNNGIEIQKLIIQ